MNQIYCESHYKQCVMVDLNRESAVKKRFACPQCIEEIMKSNKDKIEQYKSLESFFLQWGTFSKENKCLIYQTMQKIEENFKFSSKFNNIIMNSISELGQQYLEDLKQKLIFFETEPYNFSLEYLQQIAEHLSDEETYLKNFQREQENYFNSFTQQIQNILEQNEIKNVSKERKFNLSIVRQEVNMNFKMIPQKSLLNLTGMKGLIISFLIMILINNLRQKEGNNNSISNQKANSYSYQIIKSNIYEQNIKCSVFAFNQDNSLMIAGCEDTIKVFEFEDGFVNCLQTLSGHNKNISALYFMKNSNEFISGDIVGSMFFWKLNKNNKWYLQQKAKQHTQRINQIIMNYKEDLIISCSHDRQIIFWNFQEEWKISKVINEHKDWVLSLSLNENQNQLISSGMDGSILVINKIYNNDWIVIQSMSGKSGFKLSFIGTNEFVYQPNNGQFMQVFQSNGEQYNQIKLFDLKKGSIESIWYFPQVFINKKQILINKYDNYIHIIMKNQHGELQIQQQIQFQNNHVYGGVSNDGEYLITWDENNQFQLRKCIPSF